MTDDLERDLRTMLAERAGDVRSVPATLLTVDPADAAPAPDGDGDAEVLDLGVRRADLRAAARRHWPLLVAAAAVVVIVVGVLTTLVGPDRHRHVPPAHHTSPPTPVRTIERATCPIADPATWNAAVRAAGAELHGVDDSQGGPGVQAVLPNGDVLVSYDLANDPKHEVGVHLGVLSSGSTTPRDLGYFGVPLAVNRSFELDVDVDDATRTAIVSVDIGENNRSESVTAIYAVDLATGHRVRLMTASHYPKATDVSQGYALNGTVYWEVDPLRKGRVDTVYAVPVSGGSASVVARGNDVYLDKSALGIQWSEGNQIDRPADVPAAVQRHARTDLFGTFDSFVTDGTAYAWQTSSGALDWYSPVAGHILSFRGLLGVPGRSQGFVNSVAGPLVSFQTRSGKSQGVLDTRTGAVIPATTGGTFLGSEGGVAVGDPVSDGPNTLAPGRVMRLDTSALPPTAC